MWRYLLQLIRPGQWSFRFGAQTIQFDRRIWDIVQISDTFVLQFADTDYNLDDPMQGRNIEAYDASGQLLWRIEGTGVTFPSSWRQIAWGWGRRVQHEVPESYMSLWLDEQTGDLMAASISTRYVIDPETGLHLSSEYKDR